MDMEPNIIITGLDIQIKPVVRDDNIKALVNWVFKSNCGNIIVRNGTIRLKEFGTKSLLSYDVPAIKGKFRYTKAFIIDNKELYRKLCLKTVEEYCKVTGEMPNTVIFEAEEVDSKDIPF